MNLTIILTFLTSFFNAIPKLLQKKHAPCIMMAIILFCLNIGWDYYKQQQMKIIPIQECYSNSLASNRIYSSDNIIKQMIDNTLINCGIGAFISWIQLEYRDGKPKSIFIDVRGIVQKNGKPISLKEMNLDNYGIEREIDKNTEEYFFPLEVGVVYEIDRATARRRGLKFITDIFDGLKLKNIEATKFTIIKKDAKIIWIVNLTFAIFPPIDDYEQERILLNISQKLQERLSYDTARFTHIQKR